MIKVDLRQKKYGCRKTYLDALPARTISCDHELVRQEKYNFDNSPEGVLVFLGFATRVINVLACWGKWRCLRSLVV